MTTSLQLTIEKVVHGGSGLARTDEGVVLVPGTLPGEVVRAVLSGKKHGMPQFRLTEVLQPAVGRREPPCSQFGVCGGCDWLFIEPALQVALKKAIFMEVLQRIGKLSDVSDPEEFSGSEFGYRRRAQIKIAESGVAGFFRRGSNDVVPLDHCPLCTGRINSLLKQVARQPGLLPHQCTSLKVIDGDRNIASYPLIPGLTCTATEISCNGRLFEVNGGDFFQSNGLLLEKLVSWIAAHCSGNTLVDLYGGTGFFSVLLADHFKSGLLIESEKGMVRRARLNFSRNGITNIVAHALPAEVAERYVQHTPDVMVVDPPRPGLTRNAREAVGRIGAKTLIYVSCNCATQARDVGYLVKKCGYAIAASALFDLYPDTHHTETVVVLKKGSRQK